MNYSEQELLSIYRCAIGLSPILTLAPENERNPLDKELLATLHSRYDTLLAKADPLLLNVEDVAAEASYSYAADGRSLTISLPQRCIRPLSLHVSGWRHTIDTFHAPGSLPHRRQSNALLRATPARPVAIRDAHSIIAFGLPGVATACSFSLRAVARPADNSFTLDPSLLPQIIY